MSDPPIHVADNPEASRYEIRVGDQLAGFVTYQLEPGRAVLNHAEIDPTFSGHGLGSRLATGTLDDIRHRHLTVTPRCPFIADFIDEHPDYADLVTPRPGGAT